MRRTILTLAAVLCVATAPVELAAQIPDRETQTTTVESMLERRRWGDARVALRDLIAELDPIYRDVLYLRYQCSMKNPDIAQLLNVSENVVKVRYHRAKKILLQKRGKELDEMRKNGSV